MLGPGVEISDLAFENIGNCRSEPQRCSEVSSAVRIFSQVTSSTTFFTGSVEDEWK
jgi:hypothetical protein